MFSLWSVTRALFPIGQNRPVQIAVKARLVGDGGFGGGLEVTITRGNM
jgi:hypothetical protein